MGFMENSDREVYDILQKELNRQTHHLEMIASENFTFPAVMEASGSIFTNKYAEGYPYKRYYGGCEFADEIEALAIERAKKTIWMRICKRTASLRLSGERCGIYGPFEPIR